MSALVNELMGLADRGQLRVRLHVVGTDWAILVPIHAVGTSVGEPNDPVTIHVRVDQGKLREVLGGR